MVRTTRLPRGEKAPHPKARRTVLVYTAMPSARPCVGTLKADGTAECYECGMPMFPTSRTATQVHLDCANRHYCDAPLPRDPALVRLVDNWIARRGAQLHVQHERWGTDDKSGRDERDI